MNEAAKIIIPHGKKIPTLSEALRKAYDVYLKAQNLPEGVENIKHIPPFNVYRLKEKKETVLIFKP